LDVAALRIVFFRVHSWLPPHFRLSEVAVPVYFAGVNCIVTAGPTFEPLDDVRRLTNFSSGKLGSQLADFLVAQGHRVTLLRGHYSTFHEKNAAQKIVPFDTTADLKAKLESFASEKIDAIFHAAAVSDFGFGKIFERSANGELRELIAGKISTRDGTLLAELVTTPKIISTLRQTFPASCIVGWKYEVDGDRASVIAKAAKQIAENKTDACVANGRAYGFGFGLVQRDGSEHFSNTTDLYRALEKLAREKEL
jgi:phosphopantothenoylcysteine decarboxylase/phosphopantothenate--cysteine ligase